MAKMTVCFTLDSENDRRIVRWLESLPRGDKSRAIREALHVYLGKGGINLGDIYEAIQDLTVLVKSGVVVTQPAETGFQSDVPADVLEKLDSLGL